MSINQDLKNCSKLEKDLKNVIHNCRSIVENNKTMLNINSQNRSNYVKENDISLEKVVRDMTLVLYDLKNGIKLVKSAPKINSFQNIENELEQMYRKHEESKNHQLENETKKATVNRNKSPLKKPTTNSKQTVRKRSSQNVSQNNHKSLENKPNSTRPLKRKESNDGQNKVTVTTVNFPTEKEKIGSTTNRSNKISSDRPKTCPAQTLRKPNISGKKVPSIPPPREVYNPLGLLKDEVDKAIKDKKTFTIKGQFPAVRRALLKRGWVEKYHPNYRERLNDEIRKYQQMSLVELVDLLRNKDLAKTISRMIKSKLLKDHQVDLYWDHTFDAFKECPDTRKLTLINKFRRESFSYTSKQGLCKAAQENYWLQIPGVARINHPRCFVLAKGGDTKYFLKDFGLTAATGLLKWIVRNNITGESKIISDTGKISVKTFDFAVTECYKYIKTKKHQDIDEEISEALENEWHEFLEQYYKAVHIGNHFKLPNKSSSPSLGSDLAEPLKNVSVAKDMVRKANYILNELREYMPCLDMDGYMNIWILKPINSSRGQGIHICRTLQFILDIVRKNPNRRYVIQKYIERPLLIHETKFDIRQWFLVSSSYPLKIWLYKLSYLRFSCQTYNLRKLHESIHLTNNSVQAKYMKNVTRDPLLPSYGMWDSNQFKKYLSDIGYPTIFEETIYPGMKQCITGAMIAHRDKIDRRKNCFEIYGADFMLSENFDPWLLEINSNPALHASTPVTARMCPEVLEDVIKVVVDYDRNKNASTGNFELIYEEKLGNQTANTKANFQITGTPVPDDYFCEVPLKEDSKSNLPISKKIEAPDPGRLLLKTGESMKEALKNLLEVVKKEKMKRRCRQEKAIEVQSKDDVLVAPLNREVISIYENTLSHKSSDHSEIFPELNLTSCEELSEDESKKITKVLSDIAALQNKKKLLTNLVEVVDTLANTSKKTKV